MMAPTMAIGRDIGEKLARIAAAQRLTQGQVAVKAKLSQPTVSALFNGAIKDPPISTVLKTAQALGVTLDQIVGLTPLPAPEVVEPAQDEIPAWGRDLKRTVDTLLERLAADNVAVAEALEQDADIGQRKPAGGSRGKRGRGKT
jgi:transcriptional regulator with XRE-family HTH domain